MIPRLPVPKVIPVVFSSGDEFANFSAKAQTLFGEAKADAVNSSYQRKLHILTNLVDLLVQKTGLPAEASKRRSAAILTSPGVLFAFTIYNLRGYHCIVEIGNEVIEKKSAHFIRVYDLESSYLLFAFRLVNDKKYPLLAIPYKLNVKHEKFSNKRIQSELVNPFAKLFDVEDVLWSNVTNPARRFSSPVVAAPVSMDASKVQLAIEVKDSTNTLTSQFVVATEVQSYYFARTSMQIDQVIAPPTAPLQTMQPVKQSKAKKRKLSTKSEKKAKKSAKGKNPRVIIKINIGSTTNYPILASDFIDECTKNKDLVWGDRFNAFISHIRNRKTITISGVGYTAFSVYVALNTGKSFETIEVQINEAAFARLPAYACYAHCTSWFHRFDSTGQLMPLDEKEKHSSKAFKEVCFIHKKQKIFTAFATHDTFGEEKGNTVHTAVGEAQSVHRFNENGIPSSAVLGFFSQSIYKLFGYKNVDLVDASHLPASDKRSQSGVDIIEKLSNVVWGVKGRSSHGMRLGIASYLSYGKSGYQRIFEANGMRCQPRNGTFKTAFDGVYTQSDAERKAALDNLPKLTLEKWYHLLDQQKTEAMFALPKERARILEIMRSIPEFEGFAAGRSAEQPLLGEELDDLVEHIAALERGHDNILKLCSAYHDYIAEPNTFKRDNLLIKLRENIAADDEFFRDNMRLRRDPPTTIDELFKNEKVLAQFIKDLETKTLAAKEQSAAAFAFCIDEATGKEEYRDYQALEWTAHLPIALRELARRNLSDMPRAASAEQKRDSKSALANPFVGKTTTLVDLLNNIKEKSRLAGGVGPNSDYLAFMNLLTHGVHQNKSPSLAPIASGAMQTVKKHVQALTTNSYFYIIDEAPPETKAVPALSIKGPG